ncbi:LamG-like jellyroll fold domain-containing protein, partial [Kineococcus glutinatus]|uniref:LamG-like jellyroll fold domain-containing protein n=1 Tax=Kineococcus glutinatus TaxID=1070872 RepID=UPI0031E8039F
MGGAVVSRRWRAALAVLLLAVVVQVLPGVSAVFTSSTAHPVTGASRANYVCDAYGGAIPVTTGVTNFWRVGEAAGTSAVDSVGGLTATYVNGPTLGAVRPSTKETNTAVALDPTHLADLAAGRPATASSEWTPPGQPTNVASHMTDADVTTYWESTVATPYVSSTAQVDLGVTVVVSKVVVRLPPAWTTRTQTFSVLGSNDGTTFTQLVASQSYVFTYSTDASASNVVTITLPASTTTYRHVRLSFTSPSTWTAAQVGSLEVYGPPGSYVETGSTAFGFPGTAPFSVEGWAWFTSTGTTGIYPRLVSNEVPTTATRYGWVLSYHPPTKALFFERFNGYNSSNNTASSKQGVSTTVPVADAWHHFAATFDGTTMAVYVDGVGATNSSGGSVSLPSTGSTLRFGSISGVPGAVSPSTTWHGGIDDVAIYDRALTASRVGVHYRSNCTYPSVVHRIPGLQSLWRLDEGNTATTAEDNYGGPASCTRAGSAVVSGDPSALPSGTGTSYTLSGTGHLTCGVHHPYTGNSPFSVELWFRADALPAAGTTARLVSKEQGTSGATSGWAISLGPDGKLTFERSSAGTRQYSTSAAVTTGGWHLLTAVYDGTSTKLYLDGAASGSSGGTNVSVPATTTALLIGAGSGGATWQGGID